MTSKTQYPIAILALIALVAAVMPACAQQTFDQCCQAAEKAKSTGDMPAMEKALLQAHRLGQGTEYTWRSLAWAQGREGKWQESLKNARENVKRNGECGWSLQQLADSLISAGDFTQAKATLDKADALHANLIGTSQGAIDGAKDRLKSYSGERVYSMRWKIPADAFDGGDFTMLMPAMNTPRQTCTYTVTNAASYEPIKDGKRDLVKIVEKSGEPCWIDATLTLKGFAIGRKKLAELTSTDYPAEAKGCLGPFQHCVLFDPTIPECADAAAKLKGKTPYETVQNILNWMGDNFRYDGEAKPDGLKGFLTIKKGVCHHWCSGFTALCRAAGVPAVVAHGSALPGEKRFTDKNGSHGWAEVYFVGAGWIPVDPLNRESLAMFGGKTYLTTDCANWTKDDDHFKYNSIQSINFSGSIVSDTL
jgi:hypothetical protein